MEHRIDSPFRLKLVDGKSLEQFLPAQEIVFESGYEQALSESPRATQEINLSFRDELVDQVRLIDIHISVLDDLFERLYSNRVLHKLSTLNFQGKDNIILRQYKIKA